MYWHSSLIYFSLDKISKILTYQQILPLTVSSSTLKNSPVFWSTLYLMAGAKTRRVICVRKDGAKTHECLYTGEFIIKIVMHMYV